MVGFLSDPFNVDLYYCYCCFNALMPKITGEGEKTEGRKRRGMGEGKDRRNCTS